MHFVHHSYQLGETIAAIATPPGEGGIAVIRVSGEQSISVINKIFSIRVENIPSHTARYGRILDPTSGSTVDQVLLLVMRNPRSFTGEDVVEIHCHGGSFISRKILELVLASGARAARPGEFSFRAFMNGKLDLSQAEAIQDLIGAKNDHSLTAARHQLEGVLSQQIQAFQRELVDIAAILEAWVDFPEEGLEFAPFERVCEQLLHIEQHLETLIATFRDGRLLKEGVSLCLVGTPNVGKSSLMNALLGHDRAIVTPIPGTTRDLIEAPLLLNGMHFHLTDTAGIRQTEEVIETEGILRSLKTLQEADIILLVLDSQKGIQEEDQYVWAQLPPEKTIAVWNKMDLMAEPPQTTPFPRAVFLSAKMHWGLDTLKTAIESLIWEKGPPSKEEVIITQVRHKEALSQAAQACRSVREGLVNRVSPEFLTLDMQVALRELGKIMGFDITEDILSAIFSKFCLGK